VEAGLDQGRRDDLTGGGLIRATQSLVCYSSATEFYRFFQELSCGLAHREVLQFLGCDPAGLACITTGIRFATDVIGQKIHNHIVKPDTSLIVALNHIKGIHWVFSPNDDPGLFPDLSLGDSSNLKPAT